MARFLRFFSDLLDQSTQIGAEIPIAGEEASHALRVLRLKVGDQATLLNGQGLSAECLVIEAGKRSLVVRAQEIAVSNPPNTRITMAIAPMKKDFDDVVVRLAEIGVDRIIPIGTRFGEVDFSRKDAKNYALRMKKLAIRAAKQSGRAFLCEITPQIAFNALELPHHSYICEPNANTPLLAAELPPQTDQIGLVIGPEGGFSEPELEYASEAGWIPVGLGETILRAGTAAIVSAGVLSARIRN